jgi:hypothetical protein
MTFNRLQILEHSKGCEGLLTGDSEFRKATLILMITWFPFPLWYILSPEGLDLITDITIIQMGWAFLNITAKFTLIFYIQRIKDNYCNRLKVTREMRGGGARRDGVEDDDEGDVKPISGDARACVTETMNFLGMAENTERFLRLLQEAQVTTLEHIARLQKQDCDTLQLPFDLVRAVQKRHRVWALEMVDDAEKGLEAGEKHYELGFSPKKTAKEEGSRNGEESTTLVQPASPTVQSQQSNVVPFQPHPMQSYPFPPGAVVPFPPPVSDLPPFGHQFPPPSGSPAELWFQPAGGGFINSQTMPNHYSLPVQSDDLLDMSRGILKDWRRRCWSALKRTLIAFLKLLERR